MEAKEAIDLTEVETDALLGALNGRARESAVRDFCNEHGELDVDDLETDELIEELEERMACGHSAALAFFERFERPAARPAPPLPPLGARAQIDGAVVTMPASALAWALAVCVHGIEERSSIPIIGMVRLRAEHQSLRFSGTNLDHQVDAFVPFEGLLAGADFAGFCFRPDAALALVSRLKSDETVSIVREGASVTIAWRDGTVWLPCQDEDDFPGLFIDDHIDSCHLSETFVADILDRARHAVSDEETRYYLNGVCLWGKDQGHAVATDGHRMAAFALDLPPAFGDQLIVPKAAVDIWRTLFRNTAHRLALHKNTTITVETGQVWLSTKLIDGAFPDWKRVLPKTLNHVMKLERARVLSAARALLLLSLSNQRSNALRFETMGDKLVLAAKGDDDVGSARIEIARACEASLPHVLGLNGRYLIETLEQVRSDTVHLSQKAAEEPILVVGEDRPAELFVLMPLRV